MKPQVYYFGTLPDGFSSYPGDHTRVFFEKFIECSKNQVQIVVHREDNLLYYGYVRRFGNAHFGMCLCIDHLYKDVGKLFTVFDEVFAEMVRKGDILKMVSPPYSNKKSSHEVRKADLLKVVSMAHIEWAIKSYIIESVALREYARFVVEESGVSRMGFLEDEQLPPVDFSISINDCLDISLEAPLPQIVAALKRYPNVYIAKKYAEIEKVTSFARAIEGKNAEINALKGEVQKQKKLNADVSARLAKVKAQQKNMMWVSVLGAIVLILGVVIWNKVLFPSEVTHYETGEFVYYGPLKDSKPHGVGVAIYPKNDKNGRLYYIGRFEYGERQDTAAILFYRDGNYFYGSMRGDKWEKGVVFKNSDNSHFEGSFRNNVPYDGVWYDHRESYKLVGGNIQQ